MRRFDRLRCFLDDLPLSGRRQRDPQLTLQTLQPVKRNAAAVLELCNHGRGGLVVLLRPHIFRPLGCEHLPAAVAAHTPLRPAAPGPRSAPAPSAPSAHKPCRGCTPDNGRHETTSHGGWGPSWRRGTRRRHCARDSKLTLPPAAGLPAAASPPPRIPR